MMSIRCCYVVLLVVLFLLETVVSITNGDEDQIGLVIGTRVGRGPDWIWGDQDGGGYGVVVGMAKWKNEANRGVRVLWDANGEWNVYRWGAEDGSFDVVKVDQPRVPPESIHWELPKPRDDSCRPAEVQALVAIYQTLNGPQWKFQQGWDAVMQQQKDQECVNAAIIDNTGSFLGIDAASDPCLLPWTGVVCENGHVISLQLNQNNLDGPTIPWGEIAKLGHLKSLDLSFNQLKGSLDGTRIESLSSLQTLELKHNLLTGTIPSEISKLKHLEWLGLSNNRLTGSIPPELGSLTSMKFCFLSHNMLAIRKYGIPESLYTLPKLAKLHPRIENNN